jgi:lipopolysaccharide/colanic/teichoic acid biosynthesis glycosyltransferase
VRKAKRATDVALTIALLAVATPVTAVAAAAMGVDMIVCPQDRGSFLYRERRISAGREFGLLKLRTLREEALARMEEPGGHARVLESDPANLTWAGRRVLKPWYLDELPQLLNVLRGEMSLVGPRPWPPSLLARQLDRGVDYRLKVPAGWTGLAQVSKGADVSFETLDLEYVRRSAASSPGAQVRLDLGILRRTVATLVRGEGLRY